MSKSDLVTTQAHFKWLPGVLSLDIKWLCW